MHVSSGISASFSVWIKVSINNVVRTIVASIIAIVMYRILCFDFFISSPCNYIRVRDYKKIGIKINC